MAYKLLGNKYDKKICFNLMKVIFIIHQSQFSNIVKENIQSAHKYSLGIIIK